MSVRLAPSILSADFAALGEAVATLERGGAARRGRRVLRDDGVRGVIVRPHLGGARECQPALIQSHPRAALGVAEEAGNQRDRRALTDPDVNGSLAAHAKARRRVLHEDVACWHFFVGTTVVVDAQREAHLLERRRCVVHGLAHNVRDDDLTRANGKSNREEGRNEKRRGETREQQKQLARAPDAGR